MIRKPWVLSWSTRSLYTVIIHGFMYTIWRTRKLYSIYKPCVTPVPLYTVHDWCTRNVYTEIISTYEINSSSFLAIFTWIHRNRQRSQNTHLPRLVVHNCPTSWSSWKRCTRFRRRRSDHTSCHFGFSLMSCRDYWLFLSWRRLYNNPIVNVSEVVDNLHSHVQWNENYMKKVHDLAKCVGSSVVIEHVPVISTVNSEAPISTRNHVPRPIFRKAKW